VGQASLALCLLLSLGARGAQAGIGSDTFVKAFTIGGTVTGLQGSGLTLHNGTANLPIAANGDFILPLLASNGQKYSVSVVQQPTAPTQVCVVTNGSGAVSGADITNILVSCDANRRWQGATQIGQSSGVSRSGQIATDGNGDALAVWAWQPDASAPPTVAFSSVFTVGSGWGTPLQVGDVGSAFRPKVAVDGAGNALSVWHSFDGSVLKVLFSRYLRNSGWSGSAAIQAQPAGSQVEPQIAVDRQGNALAVWEQSDGNRFRIVASRYTSGSGWAPSQPADTGAGGGNAGDAIQPQVTLDTHGNALIVWQQFDRATGQMSLWSNRYTVADDTWGVPVLLGPAQDDDDPDRTARIVSDANDGAWVVWNQPPQGVWVDRYVPGSGWQVPQQIGSGAGTDQPDVVVDSNGNPLAAWSQPIGGQSFIWSSQFTAGTGWGAAAPIESHTGGDAGRPKLAVTGNGAALVVWEQRVDALITSNVWALRHTAAGWGLPELISNAAGAAGQAQIASDASGNALAVWQQSDSAGNVSVWSNRFE
jgi:hypothetical protein